MTRRRPGAGAGGVSSRSTGSSCRSSAATPVVTLLEGGTPLLAAPRLSARVGARVLLKIEGANPTGSFKDRGMTMAISKAVEEGAKAVVCASTGNTSASAAAYAARAGLTCAVLIPEGHIALGQAGPGADPRGQGAPGAGQLRPGARHRPRARRARPRSPWSTRSTPTGSRARRRVRSRSSTQLGDAPDVHCIPVGNAGNITAYWKGYLRVPRRPGRPPGCPGCSASRPPAPRPSSRAIPIEHPETVATAIRIGNPASWYGATAAATRVGRRHRRGHRRRDPRGLPVPRRRGVGVLRAGVGGVGGRAPDPRAARRRRRRRRPWSASSPVTA